MTRPAVSVVMPFAGSRAEAEGALAALHGLDARPDDELILADNAGVASADDEEIAGDRVHSASPARAGATAHRNLAR